MPSLFDPGQGFFVREPSWHQLEQKVLDDWPTDWEAARVEANLLWEPEAVPLYVATPELFVPAYSQVEGWQLNRRSDTHATLGVQTTSYRLIQHHEIGRILETLRGLCFGGQSEFEGVFTLDDGKMVLVVVRDPAPQFLVGDPSPTARYLVVCVRHDGQGGLKIIRTNVRVVCANTWGLAEHTSVSEKTSFVIRHTANWDERVAEVRDKLAMSETDNERYFEISRQMISKKITPATREKFLAKLIPIGSDMSERVVGNREQDRATIRTILDGPTCIGIDKSVYGLVQAAGEFADHYRGFRRADTYVTRTLVNKEPLKIKAFRLGKQLAGVK